MSLQIKTLESEYNVQLFDRSRRQPVLTEAGNILLAQAEQVLALVDRIPDALSDEKLVGRLRIGDPDRAVRPAARRVARAARASAAARACRPGCRPNSRTASRPANSMRRSRRPVRPHPAELTWTTLYEDRLAAGATDHAERDAVTLLDALPFIRFDAQAWAGRMIAAELRRIGVRVRERGDRELTWTTLYEDRLLLAPPTTRNAMRSRSRCAAVHPLRCAGGPAA